MPRHAHTWLRLYTDILESPKVQRLPAATFRVWVNLLCLYKRADEAMPSVSEIAFALRMPEPDLVDAIDELVCARLLDQAGDTWEPHNWGERQFPTSTDRSRLRRASNADATRNVQEDPEPSRALARKEPKTLHKSKTDTEVATALHATPLQRATIDQEWFEQLRQNYPRRAGDQGWKRAMHACQARLAAGHSLDTLLDGARRYRDFIVATGKEGTVYVKQAATFFGPEEHFLEPWPTPPTKAESRLRTAFDAANEFIGADHAAR